MMRRFQFSSKVMLGLALLICLLLGGWHSLETYGTYVDVARTRSGDSIRIKGRYFSPFGPDECELVVGYAPVEEGNGSVAKHLKAKRSWFCLYCVEYDFGSLDDEFGPMSRPCQITVFLNRYDGSTVSRLKEKLVDMN